MKEKINMANFIIMWDHFSKKDLCSHFQISERTLRRYRQKCNLSKKPRGIKDVTKNDKIFKFISNAPGYSPEKYFLMVFKDENHLQDYLNKINKPYKIYNNYKTEGKVVEYIRFSR